MTVDREVIAQHEQAPPDEVSRATVIAYAVAATLLLGWFLFGWLVLRQGFVDSVGESAGAGFALLLVVSVIGTVRRSRR
ncbi:hypothetical protein [Micromonospora sp. WMMD710]|uniref:hypothetical protein n=1 Tax=Micromonospora sp. WMMD710 TaxID=3016085 RepID=UPI002417718C|nr:hypothetical protein [Micromonospora sp. WMMD710]MDG4760671.1 hypothetical protein [Micromonospora sp. WMMD710]